MRLISLLFFCVFSNLVLTQRLTKKQNHLVNTTIANQFGTVADHFKYDMGYLNLCVVNQDTFYNPNGYNYVFKLRNGSAERLDQSPFHGSNSFRYIFSWENQLHALGGYGFFTTNNNLSFFIPKLKGWSFKATKNTPPFILGLCIKNASKIYSFNNTKGGNSATKDLFDSNLYVLDLPSMQWEKFRIKDKSILTIGKAFYLQDYTLFKGETFSVLFQKNSLRYIRLINENIGLSDESELISIEGNSLNMLNNEQNTKEEVNYKIDFKTLWENSASKKTLNWESISLLSKNSNWNSFLPWMLLLVVTTVFAWFVYRFKQQKHQPNSPYSELHLKLIGLQKTTLTIEELDEIFEIVHLEPDSKKLKRTRLINELNVSKPNFIERERDESDKRRYLYKVNN